MNVWDRTPAIYFEAVREHRESLWSLVEQARGLAKAGDQAGLRALADQIRDEIEAGDDFTRTGGHLGVAIGDISAALDEVYDEAFPVRDPRDPVDVLEAPWLTASRTALVGVLVGMAGRARPSLRPLVDRAVADADVRLLRVLLRVLLRTRSGWATRKDVALALEGLHAAGALDAEIVEQAFIRDPHLGHAVVGTSATGGVVRPMSPAPAAAVRDHVDELTWRLTGLAEPVDWDELPKVLVPRGLRFVLRALDWSGDARVAAALGVAELTGDERVALIEEVGRRPAAQRLRAFKLRLPAGDADALLPLLGLAGAESLLRLVRSSSTNEVMRLDLAAILAAARQAGDEGTQQLLKLCPSEPISAALGRNRAAVLKRVKNNALRGIAAFGLLPLAEDETALQRYLALREVAKRGPKLGPNRRHSHAAAVEVALEHLAQVAGYPDGSRLEWDCEARLAQESQTSWQLDDYTVTMMLDADPRIVISKAGRELKAVPALVRKHPGYAEVREQQERLRDQARRVRNGLIERLVAGGATVDPAELARLLSLPAGAAMLPALVWRDRTGEIGLLDQVDTAGPVTVVHPFLLFELGRLGAWQAEIVRQRIQQPVKQVFRELYLLTPAEREGFDASNRFARHVVDGKVAGQLLAGRGWSTHGEYDDYQASRPAGPGLTAVLRCELHGYFGMGDVVIGDVRFLAGGSPVPLAEVSPLLFSEVMRDLDLVVSVAGTDPDGYASPMHAQSRAQLLASLIDDLNLDRVRVDGVSAVVSGSRATYRVHLNSGSIHVEPGGYLCVVPATFGAGGHRRLFLPFADDDRMTSVILSKVLLLAEDEKITDPSILAQLDRQG